MSTSGGYECLSCEFIVPRYTVVTERCGRKSFLFFVIKSVFCLPGSPGWLATDSWLSLWRCYFYLCVCGRGGKDYAHAMAHIWRPETSFPKSVLFLPLRGQCTQLKSPGLHCGWQALYRYTEQSYSPAKLLESWFFFLLRDGSYWVTQAGLNS